MSHDSGKPPEMPWVSPYLTVRDCAASKSFYEKAFGFEERTVKAEQDGSISHVAMTWSDGVIMFGPEGAYGSTRKAPATSGVECPVNLYVYCADVDALFARAAAAGAAVVMPPMDTFWGDRMGALTDPDGYGWTFATRNAPAPAPAEELAEAVA